MKPRLKLSSNFTRKTTEGRLYTVNLFRSLDTHRLRVYQATIGVEASREALGRQEKCQYAGKMTS